MERKDTEPKVIQTTENLDTEHNQRQPQSTASKAMHKGEAHKQMHKQENFTTARSEWISKKSDIHFYDTMTLIKVKCLHHHTP